MEQSRMEQAFQMNATAHPGKFADDTVIFRTRKMAIVIGYVLDVKAEWV